MNKKSFVSTIVCLTAAFFVFLAQPAASQGSYASVNGLKMYYEIHGHDSIKPVLVLIHGGGSTITTSFGTILPLLSKHRTIIAVELQGHGHTNDRPSPESFEQDADDVAALLSYLKIAQADFFGFSNGGSTALKIGIRHPEITHKIIALSALCKRNGVYSWFWDFMKNATVDNMPRQLQEAYVKAAPNPEGLTVMHDKDANRMREFNDWSDEEIKSIKAPTLIMVSDEDVIRPEHAVELFRLIPNARLMILPGKHGECIGETVSAQKNSSLPERTVSFIEEFLDSALSETK